MGNTICPAQPRDYTSLQDAPPVVFHDRFCIVTPLQYRERFREGLPDDAAFVLLGGAAAADGQWIASTAYPMDSVQMRYIGDDFDEINAVMASSPLKQITNDSVHKFFSVRHCGVGTRVSYLRADALQLLHSVSVRPCGIPM